MGSDEPMSIRAIDVLVVGGGPAGALLARGLALQGREVLVVEARAGAVAKPCGEFIAPGGVAVLARSGLLPQLEAQGRAVDRLSIVAPGARLAAALPSPGLGMRRDDLDRALLAAAGAAGSEVWRGRRVLGIAPRPEPAAGWRIRLDQGTEIDAAVLVGADGRHSRVRQWAGLGPAMARSGRHCVVVRAHGVAHGAGVEMHLGALGQIGVCPLRSAVPHLRGDEVNLNLLLSTAGAVRLGTLPIEDLLRAGINATPTLAERLRHAAFTGAVMTVAHVRQQASRVIGPGVVLIGDAGLSCDPFTGEGITNALQDAEDLLIAWSGHPAGTSSMALRSYARRHNRRRLGQRIEMRMLPWLLDRPRLSGALVSGLSSLGLGQRIVGHRHQEGMPAFAGAARPQASCGAAPCDAQDRRSHAL